MEQAFNLDKYIKLQAEEILKRIEMFDNKLYLEFGGKLFDDYHASRVLPGFAIDTKIRMLSTLKDKTEYIIVCNAFDIEQNKIRGDLSISYENEVLRLVSNFKDFGITDGYVVINQYDKQVNADKFMRKLKNLGIKTYKAYRIPNYPYDVENIVSEKGFGRNEFVPTTKPLIVVTAPGPGSGKMSICLSQLYGENKRGVKAGYAKYETFPVWNLPLKHPVNLAYEAATTDLSDKNMIDTYHLEKYGIQSVNYNRDLDVFPVLKRMFTMIHGETPYHSPTDMGVNKVGFCIDNMEAAVKASNEEIVRRYYSNLVNVKLGKFDELALNKAIAIMEEAGVSAHDRRVVDAANKKKASTKCEVNAIELADGKIITGRMTDLLMPTASMILNALKYLAGIDDRLDVLSPAAIEPIIEFKKNKLGQKNPRLHIDEVLYILALESTTVPFVNLLLEQLDKLRGLEAHSTYLNNPKSEQIFKRLGINLTSEPSNLMENSFNI